REGHAAAAAAWQARGHAAAKSRYAASSAAPVLDVAALTTTSPPHRRSPVRPGPLPVYCSLAPQPIAIVAPPAASLLAENRCGMLAQTRRRRRLPDGRSRKAQRRPHEAIFAPFCIRDGLNHAA